MSPLTSASMQPHGGKNTVPRKDDERIAQADKKTNRTSKIVLEKSSLGHVPPEHHKSSTVPSDLSSNSPVTEGPVIEKLENLFLPDSSSSSSCLKAVHAKIMQLANISFIYSPPPIDVDKMKKYAEVGCIPTSPTMKLHGECKRCVATAEEKRAVMNITLDLIKRFVKKCPEIGHQKYRCILALSAFSIASRYLDEESFFQSDFLKLFPFAFPGIEKDSQLAKKYSRDFSHFIQFFLSEIDWRILNPDVYKNFDVLMYKDGTDFAGEIAEAQLKLIRAIQY